MDGMQHGLWEGLSEDELRSIQTTYPWTVRRYADGTVLALMGDPLESLIMIDHGSLSAEFPDPQGRLMKVETLQAGEMVAGPVLFSGEATLPVQLVAEGDVVVRSLARNQVLQLLVRYPCVLENFLREAGDKINFLAEKLRMAKFHSLSQKIAAHFLRLHTEQRSSEIRLGYTIRQLAELFGVERPSLSRSLAQLETELIVCRLDRGCYRIDVARLRSLLESP
ncbi:MAG: Crp/Fnr family transcriptional regulator [Spirochaeta sp.]|nr:Crp/Fnr family transcriptional regulator [Spirochaeta sp.]